MNDNAPIEPEIEILLERLKHQDAYIRSGAIGVIEKHGIKNKQIVETLKNLASDDPNEIVRGAARDILADLGISGEPSPEPISSSKLISSLLISIVISIGVTLLIVLIAGYLFINLLHFDPDFGFILWLQVAPITAIVALLISMNMLLKRK